MKTIFSVKSFFALVLLVGSIEFCFVSQAMITPFRDPGGGPVVPWPLSFPRDTIYESEFLGTWTADVGAQELMWTLTLTRSHFDGLFIWELSSPNDPRNNLRGAGRIRNNIFVGYWEPQIPGYYGTITVHMTGGQIHMKLGFTSRDVFEKSFDRRHGIQVLPGSGPIK